MNCPNCQTQLSEGTQFCPSCGTKVNIEQENQTTVKSCPNCGNALANDAAFCPNCGIKIDNNISASQANMSHIIRDGAKKITENEFVKSAKNDIKNSQLIGAVKSKAKSTTRNIKTADAGKKKRTKIIAIIAVSVIAVLLIITNIHKCDECGDLYFGKKYNIRFFNASEEVCKDCYHDFYSWG